jgi:hypothetical protein
MDFFKLLRSECQDVDSYLIDLLDYNDINTKSAFQGLDLVNMQRDLFDSIELSVKEMSDNEPLLNNINLHGKARSAFKLSIGEKGKILSFINKAKSFNLQSAKSDVEILLQDLKGKIEMDPSLWDKIHALMSDNSEEFLYHRLILSESLRNAKGQRGNRFSNLMKKIGAYEYLKTSKSYYSFKSLNDIIPSINTVKRQIFEYRNKMELGVVNFGELKKIFIDRGFPLRIGISEDATRVKKAVNYDKSTHRVIGLLIPCDSRTGFPDNKNMEARTPEEIITMVKTKKLAICVQVIVATPMQKGMNKF